jgi:flagellar basal body-associated protein FliL
MKTKSAQKNLLFVELIVVIAFFSVAAAICTTMFVQARLDTAHSRDLTNAVIMAQNAAEIFKSSGGHMIPVILDDGLMTRVSELERRDDVIIATFEVHREGENSVLYSLKVAVREVPDE